MRKQTLVIAGLALLSTSAFASKARLDALNGYDGAGKYYISDDANVFRNAATINTHKNYVTTEWGTGASTETQAAPRAEGGFFKDGGALAYGLYLGNNGQGDDTRNANFQKQDNALDLFLGGDAGLQWGAKVHYANAKVDPGTAGSVVKKNTAFGLGLGVVAGAAEGYANVDLSDKSSGALLATDQWKQKPTFTVGGSYNMSGYTFFGELASGKVEQNYASAASTIKSTDARVGVGHIMEINPTARIITDASVVYSLAKTEGSTAALSTKTTDMTLPLTLGFEAEATSWLTLRGSVGQTVLLNNDKVESVTTSKKTLANTTTVNGGATLSFGKLAIDGLVGATSSAGVAGSKTGVLSTSNLLSRVGVTYNF
jgi:hypothetical protein